jgi:hypothetical protein
LIKIATRRDNDMIENKAEIVTRELRETLTRLYGPLLNSRDLWKILGYASQAAYRQARSRQCVPVAEFEIEGRRGRFALTNDVATWLAEQRFPIGQQETSEADASNPIPISVEDKPREKRRKKPM